METQTALQFSTYEQAVIDIMRNLPSDRVLQLVDFARFLEFQVAHENGDDALNDEEFQASQEKWETLFANPKSRRVMREMAHEALEDYRAGRTTNIAISKDGRLEPA